MQVTTLGITSLPHGHPYHEFITCFQRLRLCLPVTQRISTSRAHKLYRKRQQRGFAKARKALNPLHGQGILSRKWHCRSLLVTRERGNCGPDNHTFFARLWTTVAAVFTLQDPSDHKEASPFPFSTILFSRFCPHHLTTSSLPHSFIPNCSHHSVPLLLS